MFYLMKKTFGIPIAKILYLLLKFFFFRIMNSGAERFNGLMAMLGIVAGIGAYTVTGQMIPGIF